MKSTMTTANGFVTITRTFDDADTANRYAFNMQMLPARRSSCRAQSS